MTILYPTSNHSIHATTASRKLILLLGAPSRRNDTHARCQAAGGLSCGRGLKRVSLLQSLKGLINLGMRAGKLSESGASTASAAGNSTSESILGATVVPPEGWRGSVSAAAA